MAALTRDDYARRPLAELRRKLAEVQDRETRADTMEAALADAFAIQEIGAAIQRLEEAER